MEQHNHDAYSHGECSWIGDDDWIGIGYDWIYVYYYVEILVSIMLEECWQ